MKPALGLVRLCLSILTIPLLAQGVAFCVESEQTISLKRAVELALAHSPAAAQASERLVGSHGFASLLGQLAENTAALTNTLVSTTQRINLSECQREFPRSFRLRQPGR